MKKVFVLFLSGLLAFGAAADLCAQDFETGYFLGGNPYAFRLNPAFQSERGILSIGLGQTGGSQYVALPFRRRKFGLYFPE